MDDKLRPSHTGPKPTQHSEAAAVAEIVARHVKPEVVKVTGQENQPETEVLILPEGLEAISIKRYIDEFRTAPERRKGTAAMATLESFIEHANRFKDGDSALFAHDGGQAVEGERRFRPTLTSVLNYHTAGPDGNPRFGDHRGVYTFPISDEWAAWTKKNGEPMSQIEFAEFLEDRILDVSAAPSISALAPDHPLRQMGEALGGTFAGPTKLMELSRGLAIRVGEVVKSATNLSSGEASIQYISEHQDETGQPLKVPSLFAIAIPVFKSGALYQIPVRLRYRTRAGAITWAYELYRAEKAQRDAFEEAARQAADETELPVFFGQPE